eukprot:m.116707 g.116707  ORF g.116707 m.116707 type:complete len:118 (+) comp37582_c0_seq20:2-355(+)
MHKSFCRPFIAAPAKQYSSALLKRFLAAGANWLPTVFALSSGRGKSGVAVIRVSGPLASKTLLDVCTMKQLPRPRVATLTKLINPVSSELIDRGIALWFPVLLEKTLLSFMYTEVQL